MRLTEREYWDGVNRAAPEQPEQASAKRGAVKRIARGLLGKTLLDRGNRSWGQDQFWNVLLKRFVPVNSVGKVLEVGVAPGNEVLHFHELYGLEPFGVEFSLTGADATRVNFERNNVPPANVIQADLFDPKFLSQYQASFDVVFSRGFIEHFTAPEDAIDKHVQLAKPGGLVVITIPTLTGLHKLITSIMEPHQLAIHNLSIMRLGRFERLFTHPEMDKLYCNYHGGPNLLISHTGKAHGYKRALDGMLKKTQFLVHSLEWSVGNIDWRYWNSSLAYVGRRKRVFEPGIPPIR